MLGGHRVSLIAQAFLHAYGKGNNPHPDPAKVTPELPQWRRWPEGGLFIFIHLDLAHRRPSEHHAIPLDDDQFGNVPLIISVTDGVEVPRAVVKHCVPVWKTLRQEVARRKLEGVEMNPIDRERIIKVAVNTSNQELEQIAASRLPPPTSASTEDGTSGQISLCAQTSSW
jgi:hypothetical protein